jgi:hypothetical protein
MYEVRVYGTAGPGDFLKVYLSDYNYNILRQEFAEGKYRILEVVDEDSGDIASFASEHISVILARRLKEKPNEATVR